jgi:hypothetical protein
MGIAKTAFYVESEEGFALCPSCVGLLQFHSWVKRTLRDITGRKSIYVIRVLKCENDACPTTYHRELPDIIVPYKRYDAQTIETAIADGNSCMLEGPDESTIARWRNWFAANAANIIMALLSVAAAIEDDAEASSLAVQKQAIGNPIEAIKRIVGRKTKWLGETARILVNSSKWNFNRSAYMPG